MHPSNELTEKQTEWLKHLKRSEEQGLSLAAYGQANGIAVKKLYQWRWLLKKKGQQSFAKEKRLPREWMPVVAKPGAANRCLMRLPNGIELEWGSGDAMESLLRVIEGVLRR